MASLSPVLLVPIPFLKCILPLCTTFLYLQNIIKCCKMLLDFSQSHFLPFLLCPPYPSHPYSSRLPPPCFPAIIGLHKNVNKFYIQFQESCFLEPPREKKIVETNWELEGLIEITGGPEFGCKIGQKLQETRVQQISIPLYLANTINI